MKAKIQDKESILPHQQHLNVDIMATPNNYDDMTPDQLWDVMMSELRDMTNQERARRLYVQILTFHEKLTTATPTTAATTAAPTTATPTTAAPTTALWVADDVSADEAAALLSALAGSSSSGSGMPRSSA